MWQTTVMMIAVIALFYLMIFVPEGRRKKKYNAMISSLKVNDDVVTKGGIMGRIVNVQDDFIILQTGPDRTRIKLNKNGVGNVLNQKVDTVKEEKAAKEVKEEKKKKRRKKRKKINCHKTPPG